MIKWMVTFELRKQLPMGGMQVVGASTFTDRRPRSQDEVVELAQQVSAAVGHGFSASSTTCTGWYQLDDEPGSPERDGISKHDLEQLIADSENKLDEGAYSAGATVNALLWRLRVLAGLDASMYEWRGVPMTVGRNNVCLIEAAHDWTLCGKREAHR